MYSFFQDAVGSWHTPSILMALSWLVAGGFMAFNLKINRDERVKSHAQKTASAIEAAADRVKITELEKTAQAMKPRVISDSDISHLTERIKAIGVGRIKISSLSNNSETKDLALQLVKCFTNAGWSAEHTETAWTGTPKGLIFMIHSTENPPPVGAELPAVFSDIGLKCKGVVRADAVDAGQMTLLVGAKE